MRKLMPFLFVMGLVFGWGSTAWGANYVIYLQGRGWHSWNGELAHASGWTNVTLSYNGSARLNDSTVNNTVRNAIVNYCSNGNYCVMHCYSAGCLRMLKAVADLRNQGHTLPGLYWAEASAAASGGTKMAELSTKGFTGMLAKLFGAQEKIDFDITPYAARTTHGYVQGKMGATVYHIAGRKNLCKKILWVKFCANKYVGGGYADGAVGFDSATGASLQGNYYDCYASKYPYRAYDSGFASCSGEDRDHFGMPGKGSAIVASCLGGWNTDKFAQWSDASSEPECVDSYGECDNAFSNTGTELSKQVDLTVVASPVTATVSKTVGYTSGATCAGKCGKSSGAGCWCDSYCVSYGDCCGDYYSAKCDVINAP